MLIWSKDKIFTAPSGRTLSVSRRLVVAMVVVVILAMVVILDAVAMVVVVPAWLTLTIPDKPTNKSDGCKIKMCARSRRWIGCARTMLGRYNHSQRLILVRQAMVWEKPAVAMEVGLVVVAMGINVVAAMAMAMGGTTMDVLVVVAMAMAMGRAMAAAMVVGVLVVVAAAVMGRPR